MHKKERHISSEIYQFDQMKMNITILIYHYLLKAKRLLPGLIVLLLIWPGIEGCSTDSSARSNQKLNILFISVDDLRPELNCYGKSQIISPNIDQLAEEGMLFKRAYCNIPVCGASRASLLSGLYPTPTRFTNYGSRVEKDAPGVLSIPAHFKQNGYYTTAVGKIFHHPDDDLTSWTKEPYRPDYPNSIHQQELWRDYQSPENSWTKEKDLPLGAAGPAWEPGAVDDTVYYDGKTTQRALIELEKLAAQEKPFFFGLGYIRPHLPFNAPKKYWDLYDSAKIDLPANYHMPTNAPAAAWHNYSELRSYTNIADDTLPLPEEQVRTLRHGYYACVSFIDGQIGQITDKLKELGVYDQTIIVLWGDHGWSLGEHSLWCKHSCFNNALQTPLIVKSPKVGKGGETESLVSFIDLYPTLCDLAGLERPTHLAGKSMLPILQNPTHKVNDYLYARWQNGESIKSDRYAYTQYYDKNGQVTSSMLYDHQSDPEENVNIAGNAGYREVEKAMKRELEKHLAERDK